MFETLKKMQSDMSNMRLSLNAVRSEMNSIRGTLHSIGGDILNIYAKLARHDEQLDCIENRLELRELAEAQAKFKHPL
jgi:predicted  nucleic acid-binding Zn-ribbon protein